MPGSHFLVLGVHLASGICGFIVFIQCGKFGAIISSNTFSVSLITSPSETPTTHILGNLKFPHSSFFFPNLFLAVLSLKRSVTACGLSPVAARGARGCGGFSSCGAGAQLPLRKRDPRPQTGDWACAPCWQAGFVTRGAARKCPSHPLLCVSHLV